MSALSSRLTNAKKAYTVRNIAFDQATQLVTSAIPKAGDLVLARIERLGQHAKLELCSGRRSTLYVGDEVVVTYGNRYAPDQYESFVPTDLGSCDLVASGGVASRAECKHKKMSQPTRLQPIGLLADAKGEVLNLSRTALPEQPAQALPPIIVVVGTMMNAGKTTTAGNLVAGLKRKGLRVGAAKVTGTGSGNDRWFLSDAGADRVLDFTDMGYTSTFGLDNATCENIFVQLTRQLAFAGAEAIVIEIADGLCQRETEALLQGSVLRSLTDAMIFAASDGLGALAGVQLLRKLKHNVVALAGTITMSPLAVREASALIDIPVVTLDDLRDMKNIEGVSSLFTFAEPEVSTPTLQWVLPVTAELVA